jgi:enoyl-CoA hydratase/carnithine racemase
LHDVLADPHVISVGIARGAVSTAGAGVLLSCDFVVADTSADWHEAQDLLIRVAQARVPPSAAESLADSTITSEHLHRAGLVVEISDDPTSSASRLADELRDVPRLSLIGAKRMVDASFGQDLTAALALESELQTACLVSPEHRQIMQAKMRSRPASGPPTQT